MKDVFSVKRSADSDDVLKSLNGHFMQTIDVAAATTLEDVDSEINSKLNSIRKLTKDIERLTKIREAA